MRTKIVTFAGVPLVRIRTRRQGWQVQERPDEESSDWRDVSNGWFLTREEAEDAAPYLCHF